MLDGVALSHAEQKQMAQALQTELGRLLGDAFGGAAVQLQGGAMPRLLAAPVSFGAGVAAAELGRQIAHSVHQSLIADQKS
ncbi:MAG: hypothetical protein HYZ45_01500 [Burkholderiales bacterium]|nr:hypothetical protein [Burkholderiales bacterium]